MAATQLKLSDAIVVKATSRLKVAKAQKLFWGRRQHVSGLASLPSMALIIAAPLVVLCLYMALTQHDGSVTMAVRALRAPGTQSFLREFFPGFTVMGGLAYIGWVAFQAFLYYVLPGRIAVGPPTPGGHSLQYKINGLWSWIATLAVFVACVSTGKIDASFIAVHGGELLVAANIYGFLVTIICRVKSYLWKPNTRDVRFSGSFIHDFLSGIELKPRIGKYWDLKFIQIGRIGMNSWVLVDLSFAALQYQKLGYVTNTMLIVIGLHALYVVDFFIKEEWYLTTIDIALDHFGFSLAWGSSVWLPMIYTSQAQYLAHHPVELPWLHAAGLFGAGVIGYAIFRSANNEKFRLRQSRGQCLIWGRKPRTLRVSYQTADGAAHSSMLLCSGWWGIVRHPNYVGDLIFSFFTCAGCGFSHILPWSYFLFMATLLIQRCLRDEARCSEKYGESWQAYCKTVRWRLVPWVL